MGNMGGQGHGKPVGSEWGCASRPHWELDISRVYLFAGAPTIKYCSLGCWNNRNSWSHSPGGWGLRRQHGWFLPWPFSLAHRCQPSCDPFTQSSHYAWAPQYLSVYPHLILKGPQSEGVKAIPTDSLTLSLFKGPVSLRAVSFWGPWRSGLPCMSLGDTVQLITGGWAAQLMDKAWDPEVLTVSIWAPVGVRSWYPEEKEVVVKMDGKLG